MIVMQSERLIRNIIAKRLSFILTKHKNPYFDFILSCFYLSNFDGKRCLQSTSLGAYTSATAAIDKNVHVLFCQWSCLTLH